MEFDLLINHNKIINDFINILDKYQSYRKIMYKIKYFSKIKNYDECFELMITERNYKNSSKDDKQIIDDILKSNKIGICTPEYCYF